MKTNIPPKHSFVLRSAGICNLLRDNLKKEGDSVKLPPEYSMWQIEVNGKNEKNKKMQNLYGYARRIGIKIAIRQIGKKNIRAYRIS